MYTLIFNHLLYRAFFSNHVRTRVVFIEKQKKQNSKPVQDAMKTCIVLMQAFIAVHTVKVGVYD